MLVMVETLRISPVLIPSVYLQTSAHFWFLFLKNLVTNYWWENILRSHNFLPKIMVQSEGPISLQVLIHNPMQSPNSSKSSTLSEGITQPPLPTIPTIRTALRFTCIPVYSKLSSTLCNCFKENLNLIFILLEKGFCIQDLFWQSKNSIHVKCAVGLLRRWRASWAQVHEHNY